MSLKAALTTYPIHPLLATRWSPRAFDDQAIAASQIRALVEAARWAPSAFNEQPWRVLVGDRKTDPDGYARLLSCLKEANRRWAAKAPLLLIGVAKRSFSRNDQANPHASYDLGQAIAHLSLQATADGLYVHQMAGFDAEALKKKAAIPAGYDPVVALAVGHLSEPDSLPDDLAERERGLRRRRPQRELFFTATFGQAMVDEGSERILTLWFGKLDQNGLADQAHRTLWWKKDEVLDQLLRDEFWADHQALVAGQRESWLETPRGRLAAVIVLDQLSRNMLRDSAEMYAQDRCALELCKSSIERGDPEKLAVHERVFLYMPLMHSEMLEDQERCIALFRDLCDALTGEAKKQIGMNVDYAIRHRDIVARFGRFPHRNEILGRQSTPEELAFLDQRGSSF